MNFQRGGNLPPVIRNRAALRPGVVVFSFVLLLAGAAHANIFSVTTTNDGDIGSLRFDISIAHSGDTIDISASGTIQLANELDITNNLTIVGPGAELLTISVQNLNFSRIFNISTGATVAISGVTIRGGVIVNAENSSGDNIQGGGILNAGNLTLSQCIISDNQLQNEGLDEAGYGGAIYSSGPLTLVNCLVTNNIVYNYGFGGGICCSNALTLVNCLVQGNQAGGYGGGIEADGPLAMTNCTVSFNSISGGDYPEGGGIDVYYNATTNLLVNCTIASNSITGASQYGTGGGINVGFSSVMITSCTISGNDAGAGASLGGGIYEDTSEGGSVTLQNTIVSGNIDSHDFDLRSGVGGVISGGFNLIGDGDGAGGTDWLPSDQVGPKNGQPLDPILGPLQDNGGPTPTMAPTYLSLQVINQGTNFGIPFDQRGQPRPFNLHIIPQSAQAAAAGGDYSDIGAVELSYIPVLSISNAPNPKSPIGNATKVIISFGQFAQGPNTNFGPFGFVPTVTTSTNLPDFGVEKSTALLPVTGLGGGSSTWTASSKIVRYAGADHHFAMGDDAVPGSAFYRLNNTVTNPFIGPPITGSASNILTTTATLNGTDIPAGTNTVYWFVYGTDTNYGSTTLTNPLALSTDTMPVSADINGLTPSTTYHFQLMVTDDEWGDQYGGDQTFTNLDPVPVVSTQPAASIATTSAQLNGYINPDGPGPCNAYFEYGLTTNEPLTQSTLFFPSGNNNLYESYTATGLAPNTIYYYRIAAYNNTQAAYGAFLSFTTAVVVVQSPPGVVTTAASSVTTNSAVLNGSVNPNGADTMTYFEWGTTAGYGQYTPTNDIGTTVNPDYTATLNGLTPSGIYHYRIDAVNSGGTTQGADMSFTNAWLPVPPTLGGPGTSTDTGYPVNTTQPTCTWTSIPQASSYGLVISAYPSGTVVYQTTGLVGTSFQIPSGYLSTGAGHGIEYSWTMTSFNSLGAQSAASTPLIFTDY